jgi:hypothetical protein
MCGEPCSPAWRLSALLLGAGWVVTLAAACGDGGGDAVAIDAASHSAAAGGDTAIEANLRLQAHAATTLAPAPSQPEASEPHQAAPVAALGELPQVSEVQARELSDEALNSPVGGMAATGEEPAESLQAER